MEAKKILLLPLLLALTITAVGCHKEAKISEEELTERVVAAATGIETYQFDMDMVVDMSIEMEDEEKETTHSSRKGTGLVDIINKKMKFERSSEAELPPEGAISRSSEETYLVGDVMYTKQTISGMPSGWRKLELPEFASPWNMYYELEPQIELLKASEIKKIDTGKLNGIRCYVVKLEPNLEKLWEVTRSYEEDQKPLDLEKAFARVSVKQWFAEDSFLLIRVQMEMTIAWSSDDAPEEVIVIGEFEMVCSIETVFHHYNEPVSIELPPEAESAAE